MVHLLGQRQPPLGAAQEPIGNAYELRLLVQIHAFEAADRMIQVVHGFGENQARHIPRLEREKLDHAHADHRHALLQVGQALGCQRGVGNFSVIG